MVGIWLFKAWALLQLVLCVAVDELPLECACCFGEIGDELSVCYPCSHSYHNDCIDLSQIAGFGLPDCPRYRNIFVRFLLVLVSFRYSERALKVNPCNYEGVGGFL